MGLKSRGVARAAKRDRSSQHMGCRTQPRALVSTQCLVSPPRRLPMDLLGCFICRPSHNQPNVPQHSICPTPLWSVPPQKALANLYGSRTSRGRQMLNSAGSGDGTWWCPRENRWETPSTHTGCVGLRGGIRLLYTPLLGIHPKEMKPRSQRNICSPMFVAALFTKARI